MSRASSKRCESCRLGAPNVSLIMSRGRHLTALCISRSSCRAADASERSVFIAHNVAQQTPPDALCFSLIMSNSRRVRALCISRSSCRAQGALYFSLIMSRSGRSVLLAYHVAQQTAHGALYFSLIMSRSRSLPALCIWKPAQSASKTVTFIDTVRPLK